MPRRFSAPIPIYNTFGRPYDIRGAEVEKYLAGVAERASPEGRESILAILPQDVHDKLDLEIYHHVRRWLVALQLANWITNIILVAEETVASSQSALDVDDRFMSYINPDLASEVRDIQATINYLRTIPDTGKKARLFETLYDGLAAWMEDKVQRLYPEVSSLSLASAVVERGPICWHSIQPHARIVLRGRRPKPGRRAATWATYVIAWLVGSETTAVRLWNNLVDAQCQWGDPSKPAYALSKYWDAKKRLVDDLRAIGGQRIIPERVVFKPFPPLESSIAGAVALLGQALLGRADTEQALSESHPFFGGVFPVTPPSPPQGSQP